MVSDLIDEFPDTYIELTCHGGVEALPWEEVRIDFYDVLSVGYPYLAYDGREESYPEDEFRTDFLNRQAMATDVTIALSGVEVGTRTWSFTAQVCVEPGGVGKTMRVYMVEALDHYPVTEDYYRNAFRQAAPTDDVFIGAGTCETVTNQFVFDDVVSWPNQEDISIIAWAQEPFDQAWAEVYQAAQLPWPFTDASEIFEDGFESGDTTMWSRTVP